MGPFHIFENLKEYNPLFIGERKWKRSNERLHQIYIDRKNWGKPER
jgi:hypothetical protein